MDDITQTLLGGGDMELGAKRTVLRAAVMRQIFCPYSNDVLDGRELFK